MEFLCTIMAMLVPMTNSLTNISLNHEQLLSDTDALSAEIRSLNVQLDELKVEVETLRIVHVFL